MPTTYTDDDWTRALAMPDAEFGLFVRAQKIQRDNPSMDADHPALERMYDALAGAGLVIPEVLDSGLKSYSLSANHTTAYIAALRARAVREGRLERR